MAHVLVVDDDSDVLDLLVHQVQLLGHHPQPAGSSDEAIRVIESGEAQTVVTDLHLGDVTAADVVGRARSAGLQVVIVTASPDEAGHLADVGVTILPKPVELAALAAALPGSSRA